MSSFNTSAHDFRSQRNCFSMTGCLIFFLLMSYASCRPSETDDVSSYNDGDYTDADDIDWPNFPIAETTTKDHPIIYYKEDFVSEDYDPNKEKKSSSSSTEQSTEIKPQPRRKYKDIARRNRLNRTTETYRYIKPEKVFFDVYPIEDDSTNLDDTKFNDNFEVISLIDDNNLENTEEKHMFRKKSKKLSRRHRQRRDVLATLPESDETAVQHNLRHKRNPFYYRYSFPTYHGAFHQQRVVIYPITNAIKHPIKDPRPHNPASPVGRITTTAAPDLASRVGGVDEKEVPKKPETPPVWGSSDVTTTMAPRRSPPPLIHSGDEDYVPNSRPSSSNSNPSMSRLPTIPPRTTPRPFRTTTRPPSFGIQGNFDVDFPPLSVFDRPSTSWGRQPQTTRRTTTTTPPPPPSNSQESRGVSACIWAISACCTQSTNIRYQCFERLGCSGAFWDLNPCAEDIYRLAVEAANQYLE